MARLLIALLTVSFFLTGCNQPGKEKPAAFRVGQNDSLYSNVLKEERKFFIHVPNGDGHSRFLPQKYPVLYLLDGDTHFPAVVAMMQQLSANMVVPEMIIVGIPNTDRSRDLTPTHSEILPWDKHKKVDFLKTTGGGEAFTSFIETELIPYISKNYPTAAYRMLVGHSFGGLFAVNTLLNHPGIFNSYVVIDPSMWWDEHKLLNHADTILNRNHFDQKSLYLSVANTMRVGMDTSQVALDTAGFSDHIRSIISFARKVKINPANGIRFGWHYYHNDDHGSVPLISEYDAFRFIFDFYKPQMDADEVEPGYLLNHFRKVSEKMGYQVLPPESAINEMAYGLLSIKPKAAFDLFNLNVTNYRESSNAYIGLGDAYLALNDTAAAIKAYRTSLSIKDLPETKEKLNKIKTKKK